MATETMTQTVTDTHQHAIMPLVEPTPIMLIGLTARFGNFVSKKLKPEYEGVYQTNIIRSFPRTNNSNP